MYYLMYYINTHNISLKLNILDIKKKILYLYNTKYKLYVTTTQISHTQNEEIIKNKKKTNDLD